MIVRALGPLLRLALSPTAHGFRRSLSDPARASARLLHRITHTLSRTAYGASLGFGPSDVGDISRYRAKVPIVDYEDIRAQLERERRLGEPFFLPRVARRTERTSGSSGPCKEIPYPPALRASFARMFRIWVHDVLAFGPRLSTGRFYFSISPALGRDDDDGLATDDEYIAWPLRAALSPFFVRVPGIETERDPLAFRLKTAAKLAASRRLEIVSVWNPSFFHLLLDVIETDPERVAAQMAAPSLGIRPAARARFLRVMRDARGRWTEALWPELRLVSCWADGHADASARALAERLPQATMQPKGLLATEAPITLPLFAAQDLAGHVPLLDEAFIEVEDDDGRLYTIDQLEAGQRGRLIISQKGGLYRYRLGDHIEACPPFLATACLRFLGRGPDTVDLVGEKLNASLVQQALDAVSPSARLSMLVPTLGAPARYLWLLHTRDDVDTAALGEALDAALCRAHHYGLARKLGQLGPVVVVAGADVEDRLLSAWTATGRKAGDLKQTALLSLPLDARHLVEPPVHEAAHD